MQDSPAGPPVYKADMFAPEALRAPFAHYRALRDLGPVARLAHPDVYVVARYEQVREALRAPDALVSGEGVGFSPQFNAPGGPNLIQSDGDRHERMKAEVMKPLSPGALKQHRAMLKAMIAARVDALLDTGEFEAMAGLARVLPLQAISILVGLPEEGRAAMLDWGAATFNALGPDDARYESDFSLLREAFSYIRAQTRESVREGSWSHTLFDAVDAGRLSEAEGKGAISAYVLPSLDTTIFAKGHLLHLLARHPEQWRALREDPSLIPNAVQESLRHSSVLRWFARVAAQDHALSGVTIPKGARLMVIYASANRDERRFEDPDRFDLRRDARAQLAFGNGRHMCGGQHLARLEMEVMLEALVERCAEIEAGEPEVCANRGLYGFTSLPFVLRSTRSARARTSARAVATAI